MSRSVWLVLLAAAALVPSPAATSVSAAAPWPEVVATPLAPTFSQVTEIASAGDGSGLLYVVERNGTIKVFQPGDPGAATFLDLTSLVTSVKPEQGLLGLAFSPSFATDRAFYVNYTDVQGDTVVARYAAPSPFTADPASAQVILAVDQPFDNHNGGHLAFGPDGWLYIGMGDGGSGGDPGNRAQDDSTQLGKLLRYTPATGAVETWAKGLRNPWKFSFDSATGDLYIADVGQANWEEVNFTPAGGGPGLNYGWRRMEGAHCYPGGSACDTSGLVLPVAEYSHAEGCSITGGYVSRNVASGLAGVYYFSDYCSGTIWGLRRDDGGHWEHAAVGGLAANVTTFGLGEDGALYVAAGSGPAWKVYELSAPVSPPALPFRLTVPGLSSDR